MESKALRQTLIAGVDSFGRAVTQVYEFEATLAKSAQELEAANAAREDLEARLEEAEREARGGAQLEQFQEELKHAQGRVASANVAVDEMNAALARQSTQGAAEIERLRLAAEDARAEALSATQSREALENELSQRIDEVVTANAARTEAVNRANELEGELARFASERTEIATLRAAHEEAQGRLAAQAQEIRRLRATT